MSRVPTFYGSAVACTRTESRRSAGRVVCPGILYPRACKSYDSVSSNWDTYLSRISQWFLGCLEVTREMVDKEVQLHGLGWTRSLRRQNKPFGGGIRSYLEASYRKFSAVLAGMEKLWERELQAQRMGFETLLRHVKIAKLLKCSKTSCGMFENVMKRYAETDGCFKLPEEKRISETTITRYSDDVSLSG
ncbi:hypothetical protein RRG08_003319 [Elysia crispata]|uniref:Uncharacterized protein n=1 Tax=Elysia crispata TaxID=231223 RepID=A0AAE0Y875_9GAST|nr:hypothetical protein RRG08_003319 [Elysia crispata]